MTTLPPPARPAAAPRRSSVPTAALALRSRLASRPSSVPTAPLALRSRLAPRRSCLPTAALALRSRLASRLGGGEDGRVMLLLLGFSTLVIALIFVVASVAALHIERKQLLAAADAAALAAASAVDPAAYVAVGGGEVRVSDETVRAVVGEYLGAYAGTLGLEEVRIEQPTGTADGRAVTVTISSLARIPLIPWLTDAIPQALRIEVSATARAG